MCALGGLREYHDRVALLQTYPMFPRRDPCGLIKTFETDTLVKRKCKIEEASKPA